MAEPRYTVEETWAPGVARARDAIRRRPCVLKWADVPARAESVARERAHLLRLTHPALRALRDLDGERLVLEPIDGQPLDAHLAADPAPARGLAVQLLRALAYLHGRGLAHGDLKPANCLVEPSGRLRLIDLGQCGALGEPPRGGTRPYLAPEYEAGGALSVAGDLFAFGATFAAFVSRDAALAALIEACAREAPDRRPATAEEALAALAATVRPVDRAGGLPLRGRDAVLSAARATLAAPTGRAQLVVGGPGTGRTRLVRELRRGALEDGHATVELSAREGPGPWMRLGASLGAPERTSIADAVAGAITAAAARRITILCDDADALTGPLLEGVARGASALGAIGAGTIVLVGLLEPLPRELLRADPAVHRLTPFDASDAREALRGHGVRASPRFVTDALRAVDGRAGALVRLAARAAEAPAASVAELTRATSPARRAAPPAADLATLEAWVEDGRAHEALEALGARQGATLDALRARALAQVGDASAAVEVAAARESSLPEALRIDVAFWLERLGRYAEAEAWAERAAEALGPRPRLSLVAAMAAIAQGDLDRAEAHLAAAPEAPGATAVRLQVVRSDLALRRGDAEGAAAHAERAARDAAALDAPALVAHAEARRAAAAGLGGRPLEARDSYRRALDAAERAGDVAALPAYVVNLATSEHQTYAVADALDHYREAARLARALERPAFLGAALVNHATLLVALGAADDARPILAEGAARAAETGDRFFEAQAVLVRAELEAIGSAQEGLRLAMEAKDRFEQARMGRQALEAELLTWELGLEIDPGSALAASAFLEAERASLEAAGLGPRADLLAARAEAEAERVGPARELARRAERRAVEDGDRLLAVRALTLLARLDERAGLGASAARAERDEQVRGLAAHLPPGLRDKFLARHPLAEAPASSAPSPAGGLPTVARRIVGLTRRVLLAGDERALLTDALDEVIALTRAERAFLLRRAHDRRADEVVVARNLDGDALRRKKRSFSRTVADRVMESGRSVLTAAATDDPTLQDARSLVDLGVRSVLCVPIRAPSRIVGALYLDHRFEVAQFDDGAREVVEAVADVIGLALESARLRREAEERAEALERAHDAVSRENERRAVELERLESRIASQPAPEALPDSGVIGRSPALRVAVGIAKRVAKSDLPVLLEGESGTGKELFARLIHRRSLRADGPFLSINCGAIPEGLLESELFGHVRGAFTGALRDHPGLFRSAEGGTILLDEIGEMPKRMQTRLLRVLQEQEVRPVGAERPIRIDARIVAATNRDLEEEVRRGGFRRDLYFRLVGARVELPPLRDRPGDIPLLVEHALARIATEPGMRPVTVAPDALRALGRHAWPGNVRELEQALRRAVLVSEGDTLSAADLALEGERLSRRRALREFDRELVARALREAGGNRSQAARDLGISRMTLYRWLDRYGL